MNLQKNADGNKKLFCLFPFVAKRSTQTTVVPTTARMPSVSSVKTSTKAPMVTSMRMESTAGTEVSTSRTSAASSKKMSTYVPTQITTPCPHHDVMEDYVILSTDSIETSSNPEEKANVRPGGEPWTSTATDSNPFVIVDLSDSQPATVTQVNLVTPVNVESYAVTIEDNDGTTIFASVSIL